MGVMRLGYVHAKVTDLEEAKRHYGYTLGLKPMREEAGRASRAEGGSMAMSARSRTRSGM